MFVAMNKVIFKIRTKLTSIVNQICESQVSFHIRLKMSSCGLRLNCEIVTLCRIGIFRRSSTPLKMSETSFTNIFPNTARNKMLHAIYQNVGEWLLTTPRSRRYSASNIISAESGMFLARRLETERPADLGQTRGRLQCR